MGSKECPPTHDSFHLDASPWFPLITGVVSALVAYRLSLRAIPSIGASLRSHGVYGVDINKLPAVKRFEFASLRENLSVRRLLQHTEFQSRIVPESAGIAVGMCYVITILVSMLVVDTSALRQLSSSIFSIVLMLLLGFLDDVMDVRWRYKILFSLVSTIPILITYTGSTSVLLPIPLRGGWLGWPALVDLGSCYYVVLALVCVFCSNSINILAGINGLEAGQSLVIACSIALHCVLQLFVVTSPQDEEASTRIARHHYALSLLLTFPFIGATLALWRFNAYPSRIFVGDSFTYFAGMVLAVASITGHFMKTLMLFFLPQLANFALSLPQLFGYMPCPRHRVPTWDPERDTLTYSRNLTLLNAVLWVCGDMHERRLTQVLILIQVVCSVVAFSIRYLAAGMLF